MSVQQSFRLSLTAAVLVLLVACSASRARRSAVLTASTHPYDPDIPLPEGFRLADQSKADGPGVPHGYWRHRYAGTADVLAVRAFYLKQMPLVRWTPIDETRKNEQVIMRFIRDDRQCSVIIGNEPGWWVRTVTVEVVIAPSEPGSGKGHGPGKE